MQHQGTGRWGSCSKQAQIALACDDPHGDAHPVAASSMPSDGLDLQHRAHVGDVPAVISPLQERRDVACVAEKSRVRQVKGWIGHAISTTIPMGPCQVLEDGGAWFPQCPVVKMRVLISRRVNDKA